MSARRVKVPPFKACRKCKSLVPREATRCPVCGSTDISEDWEGTLVVINPEMSLIAKRLEISRPGRYAIKVR